MPRRARPPKRAPAPDPRYHSATVTRVINRLMLCGKKRTAEGIVYGALTLLEAARHGVGQAGQQLFIGLSAREQRQPISERTKKKARLLGRKLVSREIPRLHIPTRRTGPS